VTNVYEIEQTVRAYLLDSFLGDEAAATFSDDDDLLTVLDSLQLLRMVVAVERMYGISVQDGELSPDNLGSVRKVAAFVARKCGGASASAGPLARPADDAGGGRACGA
jgi:acyl carrier protein